jgi:hypothetical protein
VGRSGAGREGVRGKEGEMTQTLYAHMNKIKTNKQTKNQMLSHDFARTKKLLILLLLVFMFFSPVLLP